MPLSPDLSPEAKKIIEACDLVRSSGYVVLSKVDDEMWHRWLRESHDRSRSAHDETQQLLWQLGYVLDHCKELLGDKRPRWYRDVRRWWNRAGWTDPITFGGIPGSSS